MFNKIAEDKIRQAIRDGEFDNLPGEGKPIKIDENPFEPESWRVVNSLLHSNNILYPWMEKGKEIEINLNAIRRTYHQRWCSAQHEAERKQLKQELLIEIKNLNSSILDYNLRVPASVFQKSVLDFELEIINITG